MSTHSMKYKINKKGMTLIELILSMLLLSIILVFLYGLVSNIVFKEDMNDYNNTASYSLILSVIQEDLAKYNFGYRTSTNDIIDVNKVNDTTYFIYFNTLLKTTSLEITFEDGAYKLIYIDTKSKEYIWNVPAKFQIDLDKLTYAIYDEYLNNNIVFILNIPVYKTGETAQKNDPKNDIIIEYFGMAKRI